MRYSNSLESYCKQPISPEKLKAMDNLMAERAKVQWVWLRRLLISALLAVVFVCMWVLCNGFTAGVALSILFGFLMFGTLTLFIDNLSPRLGIHLQVQGKNYASTDTFLEEVEMPDDAVVASPLAKSLIQAIQAQDRKMREFEKRIVNQLCAF
ncbi:hypothetical protein [Pseudomonas amygdali]|uniref:Uncharacterized protein n=2 Tax=Pseudomonas amygdali pv. lachrymans TaxID=53707 RepID=A0ABR5KR14_PSEAV|nr:hypothetical protein [Pseudomonas amygdali]AXH59803.1 hypothetical protein PLA107_031765 [Pseudomonas amygdali pv. lachrymans str. M301315]KPC17223.1 Uncharacterized protein AC499_0425 [Pseudomonas amygdali pv. lachrymans]KPC18182.1 Uncharacterized protein AC499_1384 [Pseudomonas amygdali pv. lachrymans]RMT06232.1 hypothetical protein ALP54_102356 [Pseudomonas amygdali pv. lachrymans]